jgi:alpha-galactosidase
LRQRLLPETVASRPRPVHFNTWDALRFNHDIDALHELVGLAAQVGVERFVVDDGWFRARDDDTAGLGDWTPCARKYPQGLGPLADSVRKRGMEFGLWVEPEMISRNSDLFRHHPDWVLGDARREQPLGRNQYALDLTREECRAYLFERLASLVNDNAIAYLKWDMNRDLVHAVSGGRAAAHRQAVGVYELMDRLRARFPLLEIEACSSGGARADFEMCRRTDRIWVSDCHDPLERQQMQRAFSLFFPPEIMGSHLGPGDCPVTHRSHGVFFKSVTALFGSFGIEADLRELTPEQRTELAQFIAMYRGNRDWMHQGDIQYLGGLPADDFVVCCCMASNRSRALVSVALMKMPRSPVPGRLRVPGLDDTTDYEVRLMCPPIHEYAKRQPSMADGAGVRISAHWLTHVGVPMPVMPPESAVLVEIRPVAAT